MACGERRCGEEGRKTGREEGSERESQCCYRTQSVLLPNSLCVEFDSCECDTGQGGYELRLPSLGLHSGESELSS